MISSLPTYVIRKQALRIALTAIILFAIVQLATDTDALASFPGRNGKIAFSSFFGNDVQTVNADGTGRSTLTSGRAPRWSPNGATLAFASVPSGENDLEVFLINSDGTGSRRMTFNDLDDDRPAFSPDGSKIVFQRSEPTALREDLAPASDIYVLNLASAGEVNLTPVAGRDVDAKWCGGMIAFASNRDGDYDIYTMKPDGTSVARVTTSSFGDFSPDWSPNCTRIVFHRSDPRTEPDPADDPAADTGFDENIYSISPTGSDERLLAGSPGDEREPAYSPDGEKVLFSFRPFGATFYSATDNLYTMNSADGSVKSFLGCGDCLSNNPLLADWQPITNSAPSPGLIAGKVTDAKTKQGIAGARVDCGTGGSAVAGTDGSYLISLISAGSYTCTASYPGYQSKSQNVTVRDGQQTTANFALRK